MKLKFSWQIFENILIWNFMKIFSLGAELLHADRHMDRRTDVWTGMTKLAVAVRNFAKAPNNGTFISKPLHICHLIVYVLDCDVLQTGEYGTWKKGNYASEEPVVFTFLFHVKGETRFVNNFSPFYQRQFPRNRKRDTPTLVRISSLPSLDSFRPQSSLLHPHNSTIQPYTAQQCTLKTSLKITMKNQRILATRLSHCHDFSHSPVASTTKSVRTQKVSPRHIGVFLRFWPTTAHQTRPYGRTMLSQFLGEQFHTSGT
jgi:hypothetical protein